MTYTVVTLAISKAAYDEIRGKLEAANYHHVIMDGGELDMTHIALEPEPEPAIHGIKRWQDPK
jgi:hypothetical protein